MVFVAAAPRTAPARKKQFITGAFAAGLLRRELKAQHTDSSKSALTYGCLLRQSTLQNRGNLAAQPDVHRQLVSS